LRPVSRIPLFAVRVALLFAILPAAVGAQRPAARPARPAARPIPPAVRKYRDLVRAEFSGERARDVVAFMEQFFRVPGNIGFNATLDHVERALRSAGYVPDSAATPNDRLVYHVERRPMNRPTWEPEDAELGIVGRSAPLLRYATNRNMLAINSYSTPDTGVVGSIVYVGQVAQGDSIPAEVAGRVVLADGPVSRVFAEAVSKRGALGVLTYNMPAYTQPETHPTSIQFGSIPIDSAHRSWGIPLSRMAYDTLRAALNEGPVLVRVRTRTRMYPSEERTLVAEVRGTDSPNERFVLSAHVQEPGANDNASGVGALSEMARVLAALSSRGAIAPRRTITMLFGNEVSQTENYLAADSSRTRGVLWGMSLDMVGEDTRRTGGTFLIEKMPDPSAVWTRGEDKHTEWGGRPVPLDQLKPHYYNDVVLNRCLDQADGTRWVVRTNPFEGGSDHVPFITHNKPGVLLWHFTDVFYHTDGDRLDKVSPDELTNSGICAMLTTLTLTSADAATTRALIAEVERAAMARLDAELALSRKALAPGAGGDITKERSILRAWTDWYDGAIARMDDVEVGGDSPETTRAIAGARARVLRAGAERIARLK
jgi:hypothetical protein